MELNIVDIGDPALVKVSMKLRSINQEVIEMSTAPNGVALMVSQIEKKIVKPRSLTILRIYAHGNSGVINVSGGLYNAEDELSAISFSNLSKLDVTLRKLTPYFAQNARVELVGCDVALDSKKLISANSDGEKLLRKLAQIWQVNVLASGNPKELPISSIKFVGLVVEANPAGGLRCVPAPEINRVRP